MTPPDFIVIGAMRAGTTNLADRLAHLPEIGMSRLKETDFFIEEKNFPRGYGWYQSLFPPGKRILGEASPNYAKGDVFKGVPARIHAVRPDVKLIYMVRDPVDRFWSHYAHSALVHGALSPPREILNEDEGAHILASSMYFRQLGPFLDLFPKEQLNVVDFDEFINDPARTLSDLCGFLNIDSHPSIQKMDNSNSSEQLSATPAWALRMSQYRALTGLRGATPAWIRSALKNTVSAVSRTRRQTPPVPDDARRRVRAAVAEDADQLRRLTGRDFASWSV